MPEAGELTLLHRTVVRVGLHRRLPINTRPTDNPAGLV
ncbi:hypothetical protein FRUB_05408 [Fimbriiglobus ruber]|uniref:Uncharacterized protein n=1 Tax=Fimbriiglobus ruber TaxID=1908690 RepID=A0A225DTI5_9BACT|nr:hypothetical protein FRUB_05408 [Fimbriiglobus ruber]